MPSRSDGSASTIFTFAAPMTGTRQLGRVGGDVCRFSEPKATPQERAATGMDGCPLALDGGERNGERARGKTCLDAAERGRRSDGGEATERAEDHEHDTGANILPLANFATSGTVTAERAEPQKKRMGEDSNPRWTFAHCGFQDRRLRPLGHPSGTVSYRVLLIFAARLSLV